MNSTTTFLIAASVRLTVDIEKPVFPSGLASVSVRRGSHDDVFLSSLLASSEPIEVNGELGWTVGRPRDLPSEIDGLSIYVLSHVLSPTVVIITEGWWWVCKRGEWFPVYVHDPTNDGLQVDAADMRGRESQLVLDFECDGWGPKIPEPLGLRPIPPAVGDRDAHAGQLPPATEAAWSPESAVVD